MLIPSDPKEQYFEDTFLEMLECPRCGDNVLSFVAMDCDGEELPLFVWHDPDALADSWNIICENCGHTVSADTQDGAFAAWNEGEY